MNDQEEIRLLKSKWIDKMRNIFLGGTILFIVFGLTGNWFYHHHQQSKSDLFSILAGASVLITVIWASFHMMAGPKMPRK